MGWVYRRAVDSDPIRVAVTLCLLSIGVVTFLAQAYER
jgi:hypothetical protein